MPVAVPQAAATTRGRCGRRTGWRHRCDAGCRRQGGACPVGQAPNQRLRLCRMRPGVLARRGLLRLGCHKGRGRRRQTVEPRSGPLRPRRARQELERRPPLSIRRRLIRWPPGSPRGRPRAIRWNN
jgi:hypothetical protein